MQPGGDWPERARRVLAAMAGANDDQSTGAMLFANIRDIAAMGAGAGYGPAKHAIRPNPMRRRPGTRH
jgi:hypothetical protein